MRNDFICPKCGNAEYERHVSGSPRDDNYLAAYHCKGCEFIGTASEWQVKPELTAWTEN
jgi:hypothetical protein